MKLHCFNVIKPTKRILRQIKNKEIKMIIILIIISILTTISIAIACYNKNDSNPSKFNSFLKNALLITSSPCPSCFLIFFLSGIDPILIFYPLFLFISLFLFLRFSLYCEEYEKEAKNNLFKIRNFPGNHSNFTFEEIGKDKVKMVTVDLLLLEKEARSEIHFAGLGLTIFNLLVSWALLFLM